MTSGTTTPTLESGTLEQLLAEVDAAARRRAQRPLFREGRAVITGSEFSTAVEALARGLHAEGLGREDTVLFAVRPGVDAVMLLLAGLRCGARFTFVDAAGGAELFDSRMRLVPPTWVMADTGIWMATGLAPLRWLLRRRGIDLPALTSAGAHRTLRTGRRLPGVPRSLGMRALIAAHRGSTTDPRFPTLDPDADAALIFTSGTTGSPKAVRHTARTVVASVAAMRGHLELDEASTVYTHDAHAFLIGLLDGAGVVVSPMAVTPKHFLRTADANDVTHAFLLPVEAWRIAEACRRQGRMLPASLRQLVLYSAPVTRETLRRLHAVAPGELAISVAYGMTEIAPVSIADARAKLDWHEDGDYVGRPVAGVETMLDEDGQLLVRGPHLAAGYVGLERPSPWHETGDLARITADGAIVLLGRAKDMILRGGFNLYPGLYEDTVCRIPGVAACAFVGIADDHSGDERVILFVERSADAPAHLARAVGAALRSGETSIDVPALPDEVVVVDELPRSGRSSKIDRAALREHARDRKHGMERER